MNYKIVLRILGRIFIIEALAMLPSLFVSLCYSDGAHLSLMISMSALVVAGSLLMLLYKKNERSMRPREGFFAVALCWIGISLFGALPLYLSGVIPNYIDAVFETISGFTTTGSTIMKNVEGMPQSIMFWRSFTHWIGGMGVLVLTLAVLPAGERGSFNLMRAEATGPSSERIVPRLRKWAMILYGIYIFLSVLQAIFLLVGGQSLFDTLINVFGTAGTGGFSNYNASVGAFGNAYIEYVIGIFMLLFSVNFGMYYAVVTRSFAQIKKNTELRVFFLIVILATLIIIGNLMLSGNYESFSLALRHAFFQVASIGSSTGFSTTDFNLWPELSKGILLLLMVIGACAGSTGGGIKVIRAVMLGKSALREIKKIIHPHAVSVVHINGQPAQEKDLTGVLHYFVIYIVIIICAMLIVSAENMGFETTFSSVISAISNTGPGLGHVGPASTFADFSGLTKIVLSATMLIGRLEIYPILMLVVPSAWRKA